MCIRDRLHRRHHGLVAVGLQINDVVPPDDREHGSGNLFGRDGVIDDPVNLRQLLRIHAVTFRSRLPQGALSKGGNSQSGSQCAHNQSFHDKIL